jgi:hypothetical protein
MSSSSRILGVLERELSKQLSFTFCDLTVDDPAKLRLQDNVGFAVWVRNDAEFPLGTVWGLIEPTTVAQFRPVRFRLARLKPGEAQQVATIEALIVGQPNHGRVIDQLATVDVSATADLSELVFAEWEKPLVYAPRTGRLSAMESTRGPRVAPPSRLTSDRRPVPVGAIPLSPMDC